MKFHEIPAYIETHNNVVTKILMGESNWCAAELQHYQNYPSEVEQAVRLYKGGVPVLHQGYVYQNEHFTLKMSWENYGSFDRDFSSNRCSNAASYLAMALTYGRELESNGANIAIAIVDNDNVDVVVAEVGNGLCQIKGIYGGMNTSLDAALDMAYNTELCYGKYITKSFLVGNHALDRSIQKIIYNHFHTFPKCIVIYQDLLKLASSIYGGVLEGRIDNVLIMDVLPIPVGIKVYSGRKSSEIIPVYEKAYTIPAKKRIEVSIKDYPLPIQVEILQGDFEKTTESKHWKIRTLKRFTVGDNIEGPKSKIQIFLEVDAKGVFNIYAAFIN